MIGQRKKKIQFRIQCLVFCEEGGGRDKREDVRAERVTKEKEEKEERKGEERRGKARK